MNPQASKTLCTMFCATNRLNAAAVAPSTEVVIANVEAPFGLFVEVLELSSFAESPDPVDGLLITLIRRLHDTVAGALALLALGRFQQAEILSRTVMESALSFQYILAENSGHRLVQYFQHYVQVEREQNRKWQNEIAGSPASTHEDHQHRITDKAEALDGYEAFIQHFKATLPASPVLNRGWPSTYDICVALGKALDYRTVYMAMCSQAHHDAEDILNDFIVGSATDYEIRSEQLERETGNFSIFLLLCSIRYYLDSLAQIGDRYMFPTVQAQSARSLDVVSTLAEKVASQGFVNGEFNGFVPRRI